MSAYEDAVSVRRNEISAKARAILSMNPLFLDTETTGLDHMSEIVEIGIVDANGMIVFEFLVRPKKEIPAEATRIHGITNADVLNAPDWSMIHNHVSSIIEGRHLVIYNADHDVRLLIQTARQYKLDVPRFQAWCAMKAYAKYFGEWDGDNGNWRWQKLTAAARQMQIPLPATGNAHRAVYDCLLCLGVVQAILEA